MHIVDTDKLEIILEHMSKRMETLKQAIRCMGEEFDTLQLILQTLVQHA